MFDLKENDSLLIKRYISGSTLNEKLLDQVKENSKRIAQDKENTTANQTLNQSSSSNAKTMGLWHLLSIDNIIIATSYAQFILEGKAEEEIKELAKVAIRRELLSMLLDKWDINYRKIRKEYLLKMLENIEKIPD